MHPNLYNAIMNAIGFNEEALMVALGYLVDNKAQGVNFVGLPEQHRTLWLKTYLAKNYYK
jgi:hypothetical protein